MVDIHYEALDRCRTAARNTSGHYDDLDAGMPETAQIPTSTTIFGAVADAAGLASAIDTAWDVLSDEVTDAKHKLLGVERALDQVENNVGIADHATARAMSV